MQGMGLGAMESSHEPGWAVGEHVSKLREVNKSRKKGSERKIVTESEKELIKSTQSFLFTFPPKVLRRDSHRVRIRPYKCLWK